MSRPSKRCDPLIPLAQPQQPSEVLVGNPPQRPPPNRVSHKELLDVPLSDPDAGTNSCPSTSLRTAEDALTALRSIPELYVLSLKVDEWWRYNGCKKTLRITLSEAERVLLRAYTSDSIMPSVMRCKSNEETAVLIEPIVIALKSALAKLPPHPLKEAWRGLRITDCDVLLKAAFEGMVWNVGDVVTFSTFNSFSRNLESAGAFTSSPLGGIIFRVRDGIFRDISPFSEYSQEEEVLPIPPTHYRITKRDNANDSERVVVIEAVPAKLRMPSVLCNELKEFFKDPSYHMCPPPIQLADGNEVEYSLDILLRTHQLTYVVRTTGAMQVRTASVNQIADLLLHNAESPFALVEAPAGMGKSTMAFMLAMSQPQSASFVTLTVLVRLPQLLGVDYSRDKSASLERHVLQALLGVALSSKEELRQQVTDRVLADSSHPTMLLHMVLDGFDEVSAGKSDIISDTLRLATAGLSLRACSLVFTFTARPVRSHAGGSTLDVSKALKFAIQPWTRENALDYGRQLLGSPNISRMQLFDSFSCQLDEVDSETASIPLLVDILCRRVLSPADDAVNVDDGVNPNSRFGIIQSFVRRQLRWQMKRLLEEVNQLAYLARNPDVDEAVAGVEKVMHRIAKNSFDGNAIRRTRRESEALWTLVCRSGLLKALGTAQVFLYKMLCEYFVADRWAQDYLTNDGGVPDLCMDTRFWSVTVLLASARSGGCREEREHLIHDIARHVHWTSVGLPEQIRCLVACAVELDHLVSVAWWCKTQQPDAFALQKDFLVALAATKSVQQESFVAVLPLLVVDPAVIPEHTFQVALEARNTAFMLAVKDLYRLIPLPSMAVKLQFSPATLKDSITITTQNLSDTEMADEITQAASLATQSIQPDSLSILLQAHAALKVSNSLRFELQDGDHLPLCSSHSCSRTICSETAVQIDIVLPESGAVNSAECLDLRCAGCVRMQKSSGRSQAYLPNVTHLVAPVTLESWSWQLSDMPSLTDVDLRGLSNVKQIGDRFLSGCRLLSTVDLSGLSSLTTIGDRFLVGCRSLTTVDLSGLNSVTTIGSSFLGGCDSLVTVDLSGLSNVNAIGDHFLEGCNGLMTADLSGLNSVTTIGNGFLVGCYALRIVNLSVLGRVTTIGSHFLGWCKALMTVDLSGLTSVKQIGTGFLDGCEVSVKLRGASEVVQSLRFAVVLW